MWWNQLLTIGLWIYAIINITTLILYILAIGNREGSDEVFFIRIWNDTDFNIVGKIIITLLMVCFLPIIFIFEVLIVLIRLINWLLHLKFSDIISSIFKKRKD